MATIRDLFSALLPRVREAETEEDDPRPDPEPGEERVPITEIPYGRTEAWDDRDVDELVTVRYMRGDPLLGSRADRQDDLGRAALCYVLRHGLGRHFLLDATSMDLSLTKEEAEELREVEFDPDRKPGHADLYRYVVEESNRTRPRSGDKSNVEEDVDP